MASKVVALLKNFLKTDGEALCLVLGERLYVKRSGTKAYVGREPLTDESFSAIAEELIPGTALEDLIGNQHRMSVDSLVLPEPVEIEFGRSDGLSSITVYRCTPPAAPAAPAEPAAQPIPPSSQGCKERSMPESSQKQAPAPRQASARAESEPGRPAGSDAASPRKRRQDRPIDAILLRMLSSEASDTHLSSENVPIFRVHGQIAPQTDLKVLSSDEIEAMLDPIFPAKNRQEFAARHDTDFAYEIEGVSRFRVNVFRDRLGMGAVFRQIPMRIPTAAELNLPPAVVQLGDLNRGLILVTGPTGSGKSTTLAAILDHINSTRSDHIITIEDPIEFVHPHKKCLVNQREVGVHTAGFKEALRAALREDPDVVLVGELRDLETVAIAIETAETGHLVLGTLHTTSATSTVDRIVDQFPVDRQAQVRVMLADSMRGVISQTLLQKKGGGRVAALEILLYSSAVANLIRDGKTFQLHSIMQTSKAQGMLLLNDALIDLVRRQIVEPREAYLKAVDKPGLLAAFRSMNLPGMADFRPDAVLAGAGAGPAR